MPLPLPRTKKVAKVDASEVMYNGSRLSWHGNSGGKEFVTSSTTVNGKVCSLIKYLSPSVESELLEELQTPNESNGRRGSLPAELILCWKKKSSFKIFSQHSTYLSFWDNFFCELLVSLIMTSQSTQKVQEKKQSTTISMFLYVCVCTNFNFNYNIMRPPNQCIQFSSTHIQGGGRAARTKYTRWGLFTFWWSPPLQALVVFLEVWRSCERYPN